MQPGNWGRKKFHKLYQNKLAPDSYQFGDTCNLFINQVSLDDLGYNNQNPLLMSRHKSLSSSQGGGGGFLGAGLGVGNNNSSSCYRIGQPPPHASATPSNKIGQQFQHLQPQSPYNLINSKLSSPGASKLSLQQKPRPNTLLASSQEQQPPFINNNGNAQISNSQLLLIQNQGYRDSDALIKENSKGHSSLLKQLFSSTKHQSSFHKVKDIDYTKKRKELLDKFYTINKSEMLKQRPLFNKYFGSKAAEGKPTLKMDEYFKVNDLTKPATPQAQQDNGASTPLNLSNSAALLKRPHTTSYINIKKKDILSCTQKDFLVKTTGVRKTQKKEKQVMKPLSNEELQNVPPPLELPSANSNNRKSPKNLIDPVNEEGGGRMIEDDGKILKIYFEDFAKNQKIQEKLRLSKVKSAISLRKVLGYNDKIKTILLTSEYCQNENLGSDLMKKIFFDEIARMSVWRQLSFDEPPQKTVKLQIKSGLKINVPVELLWDTYHSLNQFIKNIVFYLDVNEKKEILNAKQKILNAIVSMHTKEAFYLCFGPKKSKIEKLVVGSNSISESNREKKLKDLAEVFELLNSQKLSKHDQVGNLFSSLDSQENDQQLLEQIKENKIRYQD